MSESVCVCVYVPKAFVNVYAHKQYIFATVQPKLNAQN